MSISILVVENQADICKRVQNLLEDAGYIVHTATGPDEAIGLLKRLARPCLLLWDAVTADEGLAMINKATLEGVHVAALPVSVHSSHPSMTKRLTSEEAILAMVRKHCPLPDRASA